MSVVQVVVVGVSYFVLYKYLLNTVGAEDFGVWALVLATTSATSVARLGLNAATVKFVSKHLARDNRPYVSHLIQTATISVGLILAIVLILLYPLLDNILAVFIRPQSKLPLAIDVLPYALVSFWLTSVSSVLESSIDGFQRVDLRGYLIIVATLLYLGGAFVLIPSRGIIGLAQAQVLQASLLALLSWGTLKRLHPILPLFPRQWKRRAFTEMFSYSINVQVIAASQLLYKPVTSAFISHFGGVTPLAYFEMANRMVTQFRALIVTAHRALVPTISHLNEREPHRLRDVYIRSMQLILYIVLASLPLYMAMTPLISDIWIGRYEPYFVVFACLLFVGWFLNMLSNPAYFANLGIGTLRWNVIGHVIIGVGNVVLGMFFGSLFGSIGVVAGFIISLLIGSFLIAYSYQLEHGIRASELFLSTHTLGLGLAVSLGSGIALATYRLLATSWASIPLAMLILGLYFSVTGFPLWLHPVRHEIQSLLTTFLRRPQSPSTQIDS